MLTGDSAYVEPNDHTRLLPQKDGGMKITTGGFSLKGKEKIIEA
jgi:hypothetical protein